MQSKETSCDLRQCLEIEGRCAMFNLRKASRAVTQLYEEVMRPSGILPTQFGLLVATRALGPTPISRMAELLVMDRTTLTRNLRPLEREGLLDVAPSTTDRRARVVRITDRGLERLEAALPLWRRAQERIEGALGVSRFQRLLDDLSALVRAAGAG